MKKRLSMMFMVIIMLSTLIMPINATDVIPKTWEAPKSLAVQDPEISGFPYATNLIFSVGSDVLEFLDAEQTDHEALGVDSVGHTAQVDWKLDDGDWHYSTKWDTADWISEEDSNGGYPSNGYLSQEVTDSVTVFDLRYEEERAKISGAYTEGATEEDYRLDLNNHTFSFRVRFLVSYWDGEESQLILSPWSETLTIGKTAEQAVKPTTLEAPTISNPVIGQNNDGSPKITFTAVTPQQVLDASSYILANDNQELAAEHEININNTGWQEAHAGAWWLSSETRDVSVPTTYDDGKVVEVNSAHIQLRMRYTYDGGDTVSAMQSPWSNIITLNTPAWSNANDWAIGELQKANELGLIPDILKGADMTQPITREEFAELAVVLYEKTSGNTATPVSPNPFNDTTNEQILKANNLEIIYGKGNGKFDPKALTNREEVATMLSRTIRAMFPDGDYSVEGAAVFADEAQISSWALDHVKYMSKQGIITGSNGNFMPKATTSAQEAAGYGVTTRDQAIAMSLRSYEKYK